MLDVLILAFQNLLSWEVLFAATLGVCWGIIGGALPGITTSTTVALLLPISFFMDMVPAFALLLGAYEGGLYGGSISAILIRTPGTAGNAATLLDGYPMAQNGEAGKALQVGLVSSFVGGLVGVAVLLTVAEPLALFALRFGPAEYFALIVLSLTIIAAVSGKSLAKGLVSGAIGLLIATIGMDPIGGTVRFTYGTIELMDGFTALALWIGLFAFSEVMNQAELSARTLTSQKGFILNFRDNNRLRLKDLKDNASATFKGSFIGVGVGALPGVGGAVGSFLAYEVVKRTSKHPEKFGTGHAEGVAATESANNSSNGGTMLPLMVFGIPGDVPTAVLFGALIVHGLRPGPELFSNQPVEVYTIFLLILLAVLLNRIAGALMLISVAKLIQVSKAILFPSVLILAVTGTYIANGSSFDIQLMVVIGVLAYVLRKFDYPLIGVAIGFVLGPHLERALGQTLATSRGDLTFFLERPLALIMLGLTVLATYVIMKQRRKLKIYGAG